MTETNQDYNKWRLLIKHIERRPNIEIIVIITGCVIAIMTMWFIGGGIKKGSQILTEKAIAKYIYDLQIP